MSSSSSSTSSTSPSTPLSRITTVTTLSKEIREPWAVAVDSKGDVLAGESNGVRRIVADGKGITSAAVTIEKASQHTMVFAVAVGIDGTIYASIGDTIHRADAKDGALSSLITLPSLILGLAVNPGNGHIAASCYNNAIYVVNPNGVASSTLLAGQPGTPGDADGLVDLANLLDKAKRATIREPRGICYTTRGDLIYADASANKIRCVSNQLTADFERALRDAITNTFPDVLFNLVASYLAELRIWTIAGTGRNAHVDGDALSVACFGNPFGIACTQGRGTAATPAIYISDHSGYIRRLANGVITTIAGHADAQLKDGAGDQAGFNGPLGLALSSDDSILYVADRYNNAVRAIALPEGVINAR